MERNIAGHFSTAKQANAFALRMNARRLAGVTYVVQEQARRKFVVYSITKVA